MIEYKVSVTYNGKTELISVISSNELRHDELRTRINRAISRTGFTFEVVSVGEPEPDPIRDAFFKGIKRG